MLTSNNFAIQEYDRITSAALVGLLNDIEDAPWGGWPLTQRGLAVKLKPYGIRPHTVRVGDRTPKGFDRADFHDAWNRYLPSSDKTSATSATSSLSQVQTLSATQPQKTPDVADHFQTQPQFNVALVADRNAVKGTNSTNGHHFDPDADLDFGLDTDPAILPSADELGIAGTCASNSGGVAPPSQSEHKEELVATTVISNSSSLSSTGNDNYDGSDDYVRDENSAAPGRTVETFDD